MNDQGPATGGAEGRREAIRSHLEAVNVDLRSKELIRGLLAECDRLARALAEAQRERDGLHAALRQWEEREAACCPEDVGFEEYVAALREAADRAAPPVPPAADGALREKAEALTELYVEHTSGCDISIQSRSAVCDCGLEERRRAATADIYAALREAADQGAPPVLYHNIEAGYRVVRVYADGSYLRDSPAGQREHVWIESPVAPTGQEPPP